MTEQEKIRGECEAQSHTQMFSTQPTMTATSRVTTHLSPRSVPTLELPSQQTPVSPVGAVGAAGTVSPLKFARFSMNEHAVALLTDLFNKSTAAVHAEIERLSELNAQLRELCSDQLLTFFSIASERLYRTLLFPLIKGNLLSNIDLKYSLSWPRLIRIIRECCNSLKRTKVNYGKNVCIALCYIPAV